MYKKLYQLNSWKSAAENLSSNKLVLIAGGAMGSSRNEKFSKKSFQGASWKFVVRLLSAMAAAWAWAFSANLIRSVGPGQQSLERHEFESIELRRGGFGGF